MLSNEANTLLHALLNKYEHSQGCKTGEPAKRRVQLNFNAGGRNDFPPYDMEDYTACEQYNQVVLQLEARGWVEKKWMRGQEGHILEKVYLCPDALEACYECLNRVPLRETLQKTLTMLEETSHAVSTPWIADCLLRHTSFAQKNQHLEAVLGSNETALKAYLQMLLFIDQHPNSSWLERVFSTQCFGDSKAFENVYRAKLLADLRIQFAQELSQPSEEELLQIVGIQKYPELFYCCGQIQLRFACGVTDYAPMVLGACFSMLDLAQAEIHLSAKAIVSIENKANYYDYVLHQRKPHELVVYHGGMLSPNRLFFFQKLLQAKPEGCSFSHWGDMDYGGFAMLLRLRNEVTVDMQPFRMGLSDLKAYESQASTFDEAYAKKLQGLSEAPLLADCKPCIAYMLEKRLRLEQEVMSAE
ncbi:MAG: DUF2220 family protein [Clostridia bacterium]